MKKKFVTRNNKLYEFPLVSTTIYDDLKLSSNTKELDNKTGGLISKVIKNKELNNFMENPQNHYCCELNTITFYFLD